MQILRATPKDATALTALAFAAKRYWGYPETWISAWSDLLTIKPDYIAQHAVYLAQRDGDLIGFGGFQLIDETAHIDHLWVSPAAMKTGVGRALFLHLEKMAGAAGATRLVAESDPNAEGFYHRQGAKTVGHVSSSVAGTPRTLPRIEKWIGR